MNTSAANAASLDYVKFQAVLKSAASAASLHGGRASGRLDHIVFVQFLGALAPKSTKKILIISDFGICKQPSRGCATAMAAIGCSTDSAYRQTVAMALPCKSTSAECLPPFKHTEPEILMIF